MDFKKNKKKDELRMGVVVYYNCKACRENTAITIFLNIFFTLLNKIYYNYFCTILILNDILFSKLLVKIAWQN